MCVDTFYLLDLELNWINFYCRKKCLCTRAFDWIGEHIEYCKFLIIFTRVLNSAILYCIKSPGNKNHKHQFLVIISYTVSSKLSEK